MPRATQTNQASTTPAMTHTGSQDDQCPVCKSSRYLNPNMRLVVNPDCWHRMCETCVGRIFGHGPAQCPIAGCKAILRRHRFRKQTFEDLQIEREVDIRREVADVMNRREEDFETLKDYNDYLEQCENVTFNLINNIDVGTTRKNLERHRARNQSSITTNRVREQEEREEATAQAAAEREAAKMRRKAALREAEDDKREAEEGRRDIVEQLARGDGNAGKIARDGAATMRQRQAIKRMQESHRSANGSAEDFVIRGLKKHEAPKVDAPYSPFAGVKYQREYFVPQEEYHIGWLDKVRNDITVTAGGYDINGYCQRALVDAFSGLGVFVADEVGARAGGAGSGTAAAVEIGGAAQQGDDVF